ncbi:MAG: DUF1788 domain-containing protein [Deltaproteobacteria bacterium]|nr:DUF1788 domain-containing protein [Deltaproteobacteria bacterium]
MHLLDSLFEEFRGQLGQPDAMNPAKSDPLYYLVYPSALMLELKQRIPIWTASLRNDGFQVERISLSDLLWRLVDESGRWEAWLELEAGAEIEQINEAVRDVLRSSDRLVDEVATSVSRQSGKTVIFLTEAEMLHPYFRTRVIESKLHDRVQVPTVIFYPGRRSGQYGLHFLDFYPVDPNYRSTLIGGEL